MTVRWGCMVMIALGLLLLALSLFMPSSAAYVAEGEQASLPSVTVTPRFLNTFRGSPVTGQVKIRTAFPAAYRINITGVPPDWLGYESGVHVDSEESVMYIINPRDSGDFLLSIEVSGSGRTFELEQSLWVGRSQADDMKSDEATAAGRGGNGLTGMFSFSEQDKAVLISAGVVIAAILTVFLGFGFFKQNL
jgi:hypothetical protein